MISRRNIRIKVMQVLYALDTLQVEDEKSDPVKSLSRLTDQTKDLFEFLLYYITEVARYAEKDAQHRASKNIKTAEDINVNTKIAGNEIVWALRENNELRAAMEKFHGAYEELPDLIKKTYQKLVITEEYKSYTAQEGRTKKEEIAIVEQIFLDFMLNDDDFISFIEGGFPDWDDDAEMLSQLVIGVLHKPVSLQLHDFLPTETWQFGRSLVKTVIEKKEFLNEQIKPKLKNWDIERIAIIDIILLEMGLAEFLYFETIPPKVTINEYIDIAKEYSTDQSGQFVNGILDSLRKDLEKNGKLDKIDFRKN